MFKKTYYGAHIAPACAYCLHGSTAADPKMILCKRKGRCVALLLLPQIQL